MTKRDRMRRRLKIEIIVARQRYVKDLGRLIYCEDPEIAARVLN